MLENYSSSLVYESLSSSFLTITRILPYKVLSVGIELLSLKPLSLDKSKIYVYLQNPYKNMLYVYRFSVIYHKTAPVTWPNDTIALH